MGFLDSGGQGAQAFTDSFLKTYMMLDESERAKQAQGIAKQMAEAKLQEMAEAKQKEAQILQKVREWRARQQGQAGLMETAPTPQVVPTGARPTLQNPSAGGDYPVYDPTGTVSSLPTSPQGAVPQQRAGLMSGGQGNVEDLLLDLSTVDSRFVPALAKKDTSSDSLFTKYLIAQMASGDRNKSIDERERHNKAIEDLRKQISDKKTDNTTDQGLRKDKIKMFDDAIDAYDKNITNYRKILEKAQPDGKTAKSMAKAITDNEKQRAVTIERKNAFLGGTSSTSKVPAGFTDTGKTSGGKKVYTDGKGNAWLE
jgi:tetratricopeptide (TPR) repeat protein